MYLNRAVEERLMLLYRSNKVVGGVYRSLGQEAISVGTALALEPQDLVAPLIRNLGAYLVRGYTPRDIFMQYMGKAWAPTRGKDGNTHFGSLEKGVIAPISMLGAMIPISVGLAFASRYLRRNAVVLTYIGDGGSSTGDFHEGLNLAAVWKVPFVLVGEHNGFAYSTPTSKQMAVKNLVERAGAYGIPAEIVDGNDVVAVYQATVKALRHARSGKGPYFLEMKTMRMCGHAAHDKADYVPPELVERWKAKDPLVRHRAHLLTELKASKLEALEKEIVDYVRAEADAAERAPLPKPDIALEGVFA